MKEYTSPNIPNTPNVKLTFNFNLIRDLSEGKNLHSVPILAMTGATDCTGPRDLILKFILYFLEGLIKRALYGLAILPTLTGDQSLFVF